MNNDLLLNKNTVKRPLALVEELSFTKKNSGDMLNCTDMNWPAFHQEQ